MHTLLTYDYPGNHIVKFVDNAVAVVLISSNDESMYMALVVWCKANNLCITVEKTKGIVVDFTRIVHTLHPPSLEEKLWSR